MDAVIIQARTGSTRLPGKILLPFYQNESILDILVKKLKKKLSMPLIIASTTNPNDDIIEAIYKKQGINIFRGDENDVLKRFIDCAEQYGAQRIIRVCADNPFLNVDSCLEILNYQADYCSYQTSRGIPSIKTHYGFWAEAMTLDALIKVSQNAREAVYHEHVSNYIYANPTKFDIKWLPIPAEIEKFKIRLTIDTVEDFEIAQKIYNDLFEYNHNFSPRDVVDYLKAKNEYLPLMHKQIEKNTK
ncbi:MAG: glycosyl transferase family 2 [Prevotellaceae bacterium]|jgi:spore coat polysaccharide biosynthesis protein SpsF|nr:glycosyl transferase family 2 [Prevotellaceae bacterium]